MNTAREQELERDHGDMAPEDMVEHECWDDTNSQEDGDPVTGLQDFQGTAHWSKDTDDDCSLRKDEEEEEESSKCNLSSSEEDAKVFKKRRTSQDTLQCVLGSTSQQECIGLTQ